MGFEIGTLSGGHGVVHAEGELDVGNAAELRAAVNAALDVQPTLVVNLAAVTFMDSVTLGVLIGAYNRARGAGGAFVVVCTDERVGRIFRITGLDQVFVIVDSLEAASEVL
ncbi:STAS domain-containing protein [Dactylosporangium matsuzakiense]|uniref:Anti-sigma factor antagonist n=1 Tax=Dactylosporangium matsuzakiense TaxID=53360 RepID=A0A9W6KUC7_9ACTN|nr:STAS domain-containing protein [Dactylosporangium matsuzakiense]UWZ41708.1 STAS domain-containing protein [Dactylosporangium matsuzakiense]GLL07350.1 anti-sigma-B factor antagonist [Dactylosporangium matsuzakiense]